MSQFVERLRLAIKDGRWDDYEEIWLDALESESTTFSEYLTASEEAIQFEEGNRAGAMLALVSAQADVQSTPLRLKYLECIARCMPEDRNHRKTLLAAYEEIYKDSPAYKVYKKLADLKRADNPSKSIQLFTQLIHFQPERYVYHRSGWGVGLITEIVSFENVAIVDFEKKPNHRIQVTALPEICELLDDNHFLVLAWKDLDRLKSLSVEDPMELMKIVLRSSKRPQPLARLREKLSGTVIPSPDWSKWWTKMRPQMKKDPEIGVDGSKTAQYFIRETEVDAIEELARRLKGTDLKERLKLLREAEKDLPTERVPELHTFFERLVHGVGHRDGEPALLLEVVLYLKHHGFAADVLPSIFELLQEAGHPGDQINLLQRAEDQREIIDLLREQSPEGWETLHEELLLEADDAPRDYLIELLVNQERGHEVNDLAIEVNRLPKKAPLFFLWLARLAAKGDYSLVPSLEGKALHDFYRRGIAILEDLSLQAEHADSSKLDLMVKRYRQRLGTHPFTLLGQLVCESETWVMREVYNQLESSRSFSDATKRRLLAYLLRKEPELLSSEIVRTSSISEDVIYATEEAIARKRKELEYLRNEKLPQIYKLIGDAAAMGDLSENYEFTSAIEERENTNRRVMELQTQLDTVEVIDLSQASTTAVSVGSCVTLTNLGTKKEERYSVLGPWDANPDEGVVSYLSPLGRGLLNSEPGAELEVELPEGVAHYRVEGISLHGT